MPTSALQLRRTNSLFAAAAAALFLAIAFFVGGMASYVSAIHWVSHTIEVRKEVYEWLATLLEGETGARGYVATGNPGFLDPYEAAVIRERSEAAAFQELVSDNPVQSRRAEAAAAEAEALMHRLRGTVTLVRSGHRDQAVAQLSSGESKEAMDAFRRGSEDILAEEERLLAERQGVAHSRATLALCGAVLLMLMAAGFLVTGWSRERAHEAKAAALAAEARGRLRAVADLGTAFSDSKSVKEISAIVVDHVVRAAGSDTLTLFRLSDSGEWLELIGERGCAPQVVERIRRISRTAGNPAAFAALERRESAWAETPSDYARLYPELANSQAQGPRAAAFFSVPLMAEGRVVGLLGAGYFRPRIFSPDERSFLTLLADLCAQALVRARAREREEEANRWFTTTLRSIGDAVIATDAEGRVRFINPVAERLTGWTGAEAQGRLLDEVFAIFSEVTRSAVESPVAKVLREGTVVGLANHTVLRSRKGVEVPIDDSGAPIRGEDGNVVGVVLVFRDASVEKRSRTRTEFLAKAGEALVSSLDYEATLSTVAQLAVPVLADWCAVDLLDPVTGRLRQVAVAHVDPSKVRLARELTEQFPPDPNSPNGPWHVIRTGEPQILEDIPEAMIDLSTSNPEHRRMLRLLMLRSAMVLPLRARRRTVGAVTFVYAESDRRYTQDDMDFAEDFARRAGLAIENATVLREAEASRERERTLRDEAELANRMKDEFLATVSHELRTPLTAILGWTVMLRRRDPEPSMDRALAIIERNAHAQTRLINDVLDLSRIISGKMVLNMEETSVSHAVEAAIETVSPAADAKGISLEAELPPEPLTIVADPDRLQQVVWNLLSNAVKFTPKGGAVTVRLLRQGSDVTIEIADNGEGIRSDVLMLVFEPFRQGDASITRRHGGLGLGLAIVKRLVDAHGGTVEAQSEGEGRGSTFTVSIPARAAVPAVVRARGEASGAASQGMAEAVRLDGLRVLVVDDEEDAREVIAESLRGQGADVYLAGSAPEALEQFPKVRPAVIVSDVAMPGTDGYALIRKIRALPSSQGAQTPAIALTAHARVEDQQRAIAAGFQVHLPKPIDPRRLSNTVRELASNPIEQPVPGAG